MILPKFGFAPGEGMGVFNHSGRRVMVRLRPAGPTWAVRSSKASLGERGEAGDDVGRKSEKGATLASLKYVGRGLLLLVEAGEEEDDGCWEAGVGGVGMVA